MRPTYLEAPDPENACDKVPVPMEARYRNGSVMVRGVPLEGEGAAKFEYFEEDGTLALVEKSISPDERSFTVYYPNGQKRLEATFKRSEEGASYDVRTTASQNLELTTGYETVHTMAQKVVVQKPHGIWELFNEDGSPLARVAFSNGETLSREQWDHTGAEVAWSLPPDAFEFRQLQLRVAAKPVYPSAPGRMGIEGATCTLVCLDQEGKPRGLFALSRAPSEFETAARDAIRKSSYVAESIGEIPLPVCTAVQTLFKVPDAPDASQRMLALGDSYTAGEGVKEEERWPAQLVAQLRSDGFDLPDPEIIARASWTTRELLAEVERAKIRAPYGLVAVLIGGNDYHAGATPEAYRRDLRKLIAKSIELAGGRPGHLVLLSIPDPAAFAMNKVAEEEAANVGAIWVDIADLGRTRASAKMYAAWVARVRQVAAQTVAKK